MRKEIRISKHAYYKITILRVHGIEISEEDIKNAILYPDAVRAGYGSRLIAEKEYDERRIMRVVYVEKENILTVVTMYLARKERYDKD
jgi:hypothetical protein